MRRCAGEVDHMRDLYAAGQWAGFNKVLAILNTYDKKFVDKGMLYDDIMELRPVGAAEEFFKDDTRRPERLRPYDPDRVRVENGDWFRAGGDCICEKMRIHILPTCPGHGVSVAAQAM